MKKFEHEIIPIAPHSWCISEFKLVNAFLVEGEEKAALIDCGCGIGDLKAAVETVTDKPVEIFLTHGHGDHTGGFYHFPNAPVYIGEEDKIFDTLMPFNNDTRRWYIENRIPFRFPGEGHVEGVLALLPNPDPGSMKLADGRNVTDGQIFDLGGRTLIGIRTPGHSDGGVCYLDNTSRILYSGDTVNSGIILFRQPDNGTQLIEQYHETVSKLWALSSQYDCLAIGHDGTIIDKQLVKDYVDLTAGLLDGSIIGAYEETGFRKGDVARLGLAELWYQCDQ